MKFMNCFIDEKGGIWKATSLYKAAKDLPIFQFDITGVNVEEVLRWKLVNLRDYLNHYQRVAQANLSKPLILRSDGYIMNGWHRVIKALFENKKYLPAQKFSVDPEPDSKEDDLGDN